MKQRLDHIFGIMAIIACAAFAASPVRADDPQMISASPVMLPGANQAVCDKLTKSGTLLAQMNMNTYVNTVQQPTSYSSCIGTLLKQANTLNNMFSNGFSFSSIVNIASQQAVTSLLDNLESKACQEINGRFNSVKNGIIAETSITNIMGRALPGQLSGALSVSMGSDGTCPSNYPVSLNGQCVTQQTATADPTGSTLAASADDAQPDDLDNVANSMGATLTAASAIPSSTTSAPVPDTYDWTPKTFPVDNPATAPYNATLCMAPNVRNDIPRDSATLDGDSPLLNPADYNDTNAPVRDGLDLAALGPSNPIVPRSDTPGPGASSAGATAQNPGGISGATAGCSTSNVKSTSATTSTGTSCTANTKKSCMSGTGCDPQNNGIGYSKDYQTGVIFAHGPYGSGANRGQCAQLVQALVPNIGHQTGVGGTITWRKGASVYKNATLQFGTPIATFFGPAPTPSATLAGHPAKTVYNYEPKTPNVYEQHTGLFLGYTDSCMFIIEEYHGLPAPHIRCMEWGQAWDGTEASLTKSKANEMHAAVNYYVVVH